MKKKLVVPQAAIKTVKTGPTHLAAADWVLGAVRDFRSTGVGDKAVAAYVKAEFEASKSFFKDPKTKDRVVDVVAECFRQKGPKWIKGNLKGMPKDLETALKPVLEKVPSPHPVRMLRGRRRLYLYHQIHHCHCSRVIVEKLSLPPPPTPRSDRN